MQIFFCISKNFTLLSMSNNNEVENECRKKYARVNKLQIHYIFPHAHTHTHNIKPGQSVFFARFKGHTLKYHIIYLNFHHLSHSWMDAFFRTRFRCHENVREKNSRQIYLFDHQEMTVFLKN